MASLCGPFPRLITLTVKKFSLLCDVLVLRRCMSRPAQLRAQGVCGPRGREHIPPAPIPAPRTEVQHRHGPFMCAWLPHPAPRLSRWVWSCGSYVNFYFIFFFNFLRQPSGELHYVCECCPSVSLPQPQQVSLTIWQMQCWGRQGSACACWRARWVTLTMWQTRRWRLWCTGANYVCESRGTRQAGCDHACLTNAEAQAPLCILSAHSSSLSEASLTAGRAQCYKHKHQDLCLCVHKVGLNAPRTRACSNSETGSAPALLSNGNMFMVVHTTQVFASVDLVN